MQWMVLLDPSDGTGNAALGPYATEEEAHAVADYVWNMSGDVGTDVAPLHEPPKLEL